MKSIVTARVLHENKLKSGDPLSQGMIALPESFFAEVDGKLQEFIFIDDSRKKAGLTLEGTRDFDLSKDVDSRNFNTLQIFLGLYPEVQQEIQIINPERDAEISTKRDLLTGKLIGIIAAHDNDTDWMAKVYRRVVGMASGLTVRVLMSALLEKSRVDPEAFLVGGKLSGALVFESEFFEFESLLDLALERGVLLQAGEYINKADGSIYAADRAKAIYLLREDVTFRYHLQQQVNQLPNSLNQVQSASVEKRIEDSDMLELAKSLGTPVLTPTFNENGSIDQQTEDARIDAERYALVDRLKEAGLLKADDVLGGLTLPDYGNANFRNDAEVVGYLKANAEVETTLADLLKL